MFTANHSAGITRGATSLATALLGALAVLLLAPRPRPWLPSATSAAGANAWTAAADPSAPKSTRAIRRPVRQRAVALA